MIKLILIFERSHNCHFTKDFMVKNILQFILIKSAKQKFQ